MEISYLDQKKRELHKLKSELEELETIKNLGVFTEKNSPYNSRSESRASSHFETRISTSQSVKLFTNPNIDKIIMKTGLENFSML